MDSVQEQHLVTAGALARAHLRVERVLYLPGLLPSARAGTHTGRDLFDLFCEDLAVLAELFPDAPGELLEELTDTLEHGTSADAVAAVDSFAAWLAENGCLGFVIYVSQGRHPTDPESMQRPLREGILFGATLSQALSRGLEWARVRPSGKWE
jgi:hypothetical protein